MAMNKNKELLSKAEKIMPGGVSSPVRAFKAVKGDPVFIKQGKGPFLIDVENKKYIDYVMSFGPLILGHSHDKVIQKIKETAEKGTSFGTPTPLEVELAEKIIEHHPAAEWVRFVNSGTEAVMSAIRLARGATKKNKIIKFEGCYHGHVDSLLVKAGSGLATFSIASSSGIPEGTTQDTIVLPLGNKELLKKVFEEHSEEIAAVIIEGIPANMGLFPQEKEFMKLIEKLTRENSSLFILDEVITGFRIGLGGATKHYNLKPDIITFGKIIGGGLPVGAYGGKSELMELIAPLGNVYQAGTLSGNPLAMSAGIATLEILEQKENELYASLNKNTKQLVEQINKIAKENEIPLNTTQIESMFWLNFDNNKPIIPQQISKKSVEIFAELHNYALQKGVYLPPSAYEIGFMSTAHNAETTEKTIEVLDKAFQKIKEKRE